MKTIVAVRNLSPGPAIHVSARYPVQDVAIDQIVANKKLDVGVISDPRRNRHKNSGAMIGK